MESPPPSQPQHILPRRNRRNPPKMKLRDRKKRASSSDSTPSTPHQQPVAKVARTQYGEVEQVEATEEVEKQVDNFFEKFRETLSGEKMVSLIKA